MFTSFEFHGFRCFKNFRIAGLTKLNLLVGLNNSGKSSALEAVNLYVQGGHPLSFAPIMERRDEVLSYPPDELGNQHTELDIRHLFHGHEISLNEDFGLSVHGLRINSSDREMCLRVGEARIEELTSENGVEIRELVKSGTWLGKYVLRCEWKSVDKAQPIWYSLLSANLGLNAPSEFWTIAKNRHALAPSKYIALDSASHATHSADLWGDIALTADQLAVENALRLIEPDISGIAFAKDKFSRHGAFRVKLSSENQPIPLGSLGEGTMRLFTLITALVSCKNGVLLVDEIDTGIHHSIMADMWKTVLEVAVKNNVQVFASTHSLDCIRGLAQICDDSSEDGEDRISMHRIERGKSESIHYSERQIAIAAYEGIETR